MTRFEGQTRKSPGALKAVADSVPPPVPLGDMEFEDRGSADRQMPQSEAPAGVDPIKWASMNRAQRRAFRRGK